MKRVFFKRLIFVLFLVTINLEAEKIKHVIGYRPAGFFSNFFGVLNHLYWCEKHKNQIPVVYWGPKCYYYIPEGYHTIGQGGNNAWTYYFKQVSHLSYVPGDHIHMRYQSPDMEMFIPGCLFTTEQRHEAKQLIDKYIHIRPYILRKINHFYEKYMKGKHTIGLHFRGTDKYTEINKYLELMNAANAYAQQYPEQEFQFLVASDEQRFIDLAQEHLKGKVIYYNAQRSLDGKPIHKLNNNFNKAQAGEEVLIETQLLSRCDVFIYADSNVSCVVLFFNPDLPIIYLDEKYPI